MCVIVGLQGCCYDNMVGAMLNKSGVRLEKNGVMVNIGRVRWVVRR